MENDFLSAALEYAEKFNFSVIPVRPSDKKPFIKWSEFQTRRATSDEIRELWRKFPTAMIGIVTGEVSEIFVIDCDTLDGYRAIQKLIPDALVFPVARTPRGGWHLYFIFPAGSKLTIGAGVIPGVDFRGNGGYIIAPPSVNGTGSAYSWAEGLSIDDVELPSLPRAIERVLKNNNEYYKERYKTADSDTARMFVEGRRDNDLFHVANVLTKGGMPAAEIVQVLENLIISWGEKPDKKWIDEKIESAKTRNIKREISVTQTIEEWVGVTSGYFSITDCHKALQGVTGANQNVIRVLLHRLSQRGIIEKHGNKDGVYRRIDNEIEPLDWKNADTNPLSLRWPFGIERMVKIYPGNIAIIAGSPNAGKTAFILNFIKLNQDHQEIHLFSSEGGKEELNQRIEKFGLPFDAWTFHAWDRSGNFQDCIKPGVVNIIDYLEIHDDFYKVGGQLKAIADRLKSGFALIALQKPTGRDAGLGGERGLEKPRLYLAMDGGRLKIVKAKSWARCDHNPNGLVQEFKIIDGCKLHTTEDWKQEILNGRGR